MKRKKIKESTPQCFKNDGRFVMARRIEADLEAWLLGAKAVGV